MGIHHLRGDWEGKSTCPRKIALQGPNEGRDEWWPELINQQQHTAAVCLSLPSTLSDLWFSGPQLVLTLGCILEPLFTLAAAVVAGEALSWSLVDVIAECHSARGNTGWTHPTHHCGDLRGHQSGDSHPELLLPVGQHWPLILPLLLPALPLHLVPHGTALLEDSTCDLFHCPLHFKASTTSSSDSQAGPINSSRA